MEQVKQNLANQSSEEEIEQSPLKNEFARKTSLPKTILLIVGFIVSFILGGVSGYSFGLKAKTSGMPQSTEPTAQPQASIQPHSSPDASEDETLEIIDGSLYRALSSGDKKLLIDEQETGRIFDFYEEVSPDKTKSFLMVQGGISLDFLYYLPAINAVAKQVDAAQEAVWSNNSRFIAYASKPADAGPLIDVYLYDTQMNEVTEISNNNNIESLDYSYLGFHNLRWLDDDSAVKVNYDAYKGELPHGEKVGEGETVLLLRK